MAPLTVFSDNADFVPDTYVAPRGVVRMHLYPRWGWPNQPVYLDANSSQSEKQGYLTGVIIGSLIIFMVFIVWVLVLVGLKCAGKRVGCASGVPRKPERPRPSIAKHREQQSQQQEIAAAQSVAPKKGDNVRGSTAFGSSSGDRRSQNHRIPSGVQAWLKSMEDDGREEEATAAVDAAHSRENSHDLDNSGGTFRVASEPVPACVQNWLDEQERGAEQTEERESAIMAAAMSGGISAAARASQSSFTSNRSRREDDIVMKKWRTSVRKFKRRMNALRIVFLFCGVLLITASALFYSKGLMSLKASLEGAQKTISYGEGVLASAHNLTAVFLDSRETVKEEADNMRYTTDEFCPLVSNISEALNLTANETATIEEMIGKVQNAMVAVGDLLEDEFTNLEKDLSSAMETADSANAALENAYPFLYAGAAVMGVQIIITLALMVEIILAWRGKKMRNCFVACMKNAVILPIFFFFLVLGWLFASLFLLAAISGADFCAAPDSNVFTLLNSVVESGSYSSSLIEYFKYFIGCDGEAKPVNIPRVANIVFDAIRAIHDFVEYLGSDKSVAAKVCGNAGANLVQSLANIVHVELHVINSIFIGLLEILQCSTFNPLYTSTIYNVLCINGVDGLAWMFGCQLCIAVCSMIMITIRAARYDVDDDEFYPLPVESKKHLSTEGEGPDSQMDAAALAAGTGAAAAAYVYPRDESSDEEQERNSVPVGEASRSVEALGDDSTLDLESDGANLALLSSLTPDQQDAIEAIGVSQEKAGVMMSEEDCIAALHKVNPELSEEQVNAVIALELLTRREDNGEADNEGNNSANVVPQMAEGNSVSVDAPESVADNCRA